ncbi:MAG: hypothetical protein IKK64_04230 [Bacteroidales bacterium]|nr:hypothetical protein [Bacteroidales bacterium]
MKYWYYLIFIPFILWQCCNSKDNSHTINRFDKDLLYISENYTDSAFSVFENKYADLFAIYYHSILKGSSDSLDAKSKVEFISSILKNSHFNKLYKDVIQEFPTMEKEELILSKAYVRYSKIFKDSYIPKIYTHVSPFGYSIITSDSLISISLDNYLGCDYEGYDGIFYKYQLPKKERKMIVPDIFRGWLYAKYPHNTENLIDGMIYEGAIIYVIEKILDNYKVDDILAYDKEKIKWCEENESLIWDAIIKSNHLYSNDPFIYSKYINEAPYCSALNGDVPGEIGKWIGYKIVSKYIAKMEIEDIVNILKGEYNIIDILKNYN